MSKWIVIILCVSMGLNAWLLSEVRRGALQPLPQEKPSEVEKAGVEKAPTLPEINGKAPATKFIFDESESDEDEDETRVARINKRRTRSASECMQLLSEGRPQELLDEELIALVLQKKIPLYALEKSLKDLERAVKIRRAAVCIFPLTD